MTAEISALELAINGLFTAKIKLANKRKDSERLGEQKAACEAKAVEYDAAVKAGRAALVELQTRVSTLSAQKEALDELLLATERKVDEVEQRSRLLSDQIAELEPKALSLQLEAESCGAFGRSRGQRGMFDFYLSPFDLYLFVIFFQIFLLVSPLITTVISRVISRLSIVN